MVQQTLRQPENMVEPRRNDKTRRLTLSIIAALGLLAFVRLTPAMPIDPSQAADRATGQQGRLPFSYLQGEPMRIGNETSSCRARPKREGETVGRGTVNGAIRLPTRTR